MDATRERTTTLLIFATALLLRLLFCFLIYPHMAEQFGSGDDYDVIARNLAAGDGYVLDGHSAAAERLPLYPWFLAASFTLFGSSDWPWQLAQSVMGGLTCVLVYALCRRHSSQPAAIGAAAFCVVHPTLVLYAARPLTETLYVLLVLLFVWAAVPRRDALAGALAGLAMLVKTTAAIHLLILLGMRMIVGLTGLRRPAPGARRKARPALALVAAALIVAPWAAWNLYNSGNTYLRTATSGRALYHGLYISRHAGWVTPAGDLNRDAELSLWNDLAQHGVTRDADVRVRDALAGTVAREWIAAHKAETTRLWLRNVLLTWYLGRSQLSMFIHALLHGPLLIAATIGTRRLWRTAPQSRELVVLCVALIVAYTAFHAVVQPAVRYILPVVPLAAVLAARGIVARD